MPAQVRVLSTACLTSFFVFGECKFILILVHAWQTLAKSIEGPGLFAVDFPFSFPLANLSLPLQMKFAQTIERVRSHAIHLIFKTPSTPNYPRVRPIPLSILASDEVGGVECGTTGKNALPRAQVAPDSHSFPHICTFTHFLKVSVRALRASLTRPDLRPRPSRARGGQGASPARRIPRL